MKFVSNHTFDFKDKNSTYISLLKEEDFDFKNKNISLIIKEQEGVNVTIETSSFIEFKIATSTLLKSLEIITKTLTTK